MWSETLFVVIAVMSGSGLQIRGQNVNSCTERPGFTDGQVPPSSSTKYQIFFDATSYQTGQNITLTLTGGSESFVSFLLDARLVSNHSIVGTFLSPPSEGTTLLCEESRLMSLNVNVSITELSATWKPPSNDIEGLGSIYFLATVWLDDSSSVDNITSSTLTPATTPSTTTTKPSSTEQVDLSGCGKTKGCYRSPEGCKLASSCEMLVTWAVDDATDAVRFELSAVVESGNPWVAFGMSHDTNMGDDSVIACLQSDSTTNLVAIEASWNVRNPRNNIPHSNAHIGILPTGQTTAIENNRIYCSFLRQKIVSPSNDQVYPIEKDNRYYLLLARGSTNGQGVKTRHNEDLPSAEPIDLTSTQDVAGNEEQHRLRVNLTKAHGILMVFAWCVFASVGILMPRYYKPTWSGKTWCGKAIWFQIHQPCMILTLILTATGFIIIFSAVKEYSDLPSPGLAHPALGICVMALVVINPIMAICRPEPDAKRRWIFNVAHFFVGFLAHVTSAVTIFLGLWQFGVEIWVMIVMAVLVGFHILVEIVLFLHKNAGAIRKCCCRSKRYSMESDIQLNTIGEPPKEHTAHDSTFTGDVFKTVVLFVHLFGVLGLAIVLASKIGTYNGNQRGPDIISTLPQ